MQVHAWFGSAYYRSVLLMTLLAFLVPAIPLRGQDANEPQSDSPSTESVGIPEGLDVYMGRRIAQTMHYSGAEWLIRNRREREERCSMMLANLGIKPGMTLCDLGCGNGFHTLQMAKLTGKQGTVYGVDIQPEMLEYMRERMEDQGIDNVIPVLGSVHNPRLPRNSLDLVLLVDVYHEFSHPVQMLESIHQSLKKDGLVVLVEYRMEDESVPIKLLHKMSKKQIEKELTANRFELAKDFDRLPWQHMRFYRKADESREQE